MLRWYRNVLGQRSLQGTGPPSTVFDTTFTSNDREHHRMGFMVIPGTELEPSKTAPGIRLAL